MSRVFDPARRERERLLQVERAGADEERERRGGAGVAETVALSQARGAAFETPKPRRGERERPYRRQAGLEWLAGRGRLSTQQKAAGERYGAVYRRAKNEGSIPSTLDVKPGMGSPAASRWRRSCSGRGQRHAQARLATLRQQLWGQGD